MTILKQGRKCLRHSIELFEGKAILLARTKIAIFFVSQLIFENIFLLPKIFYFLKMGQLRPLLH